MNFRIASLHAFVAVGEDGDEGVVAFMRGNTWIPLVASDNKRLEQLRPEAAAIARITGKTIRLVRFDQRHELEAFDGGGAGS